AHRFAIAQHRRQRSKGMTASALDDVPGLGPARRTALLKHFGSLKRLRAASVEEIATVRGMGERTARAVVAALGGAAEPSPGTAPAGPAPEGAAVRPDEAPGGARDTPVGDGAAARA
ncbi:MAG: helix-hairpin-helix domain-containing protein, partial [Cellulosimicrobium cellulans]